MDGLVLLLCIHVSTLVRGLSAALSLLLIHLLVVAHCEVLVSIATGCNWPGMVLSLFLEGFVVDVLLRALEGIIRAGALVPALLDLMVILRVDLRLHVLVHDFVHGLLVVEELVLLGA